VERQGVTVAALHPYTIGGSTIAAAAGIDPYLSPTALFLRMTGQIPEPESNGHMRIGQLIEPVIVALLEEDGRDVHYWPDEAYRDAARPWLVGHPDAIGADHGRYVIEAKATGGWALRSWNGDEPPVTWQAQVQTYMHLTQTDRAVIAALIDGTTLRTVEVTRDDRAIAMLLDRAERFYAMLCRGEIPELDGSKSTRDALHERFAEATPGRKVRASRAVRDVVAEMRQLKASMDAHEAQYEERRRRVEATMGDAEVLLDQADNVLVKWTTTHGRRLDTKRLKSDLPAVYEQFSTETTTRRFTLV
jgi:predicted phage-related endonuclease